MREARVTNPLVEQFRRGGVPNELRLMAAQGALPLKPEDLVELLTDLLARPRGRGAGGGAGSRLAGFPARSSLPHPEGPRDAARPCWRWAVAYRPERELREVALQNTSLAGRGDRGARSRRCSEELAELVVINQMRLLRRTSLLEALETNPGLSNDQKRRLRELRETFHIGGRQRRRLRRPAPGARAASARRRPRPRPRHRRPADRREDEALARYLSEPRSGRSRRRSAPSRRSTA